MCVKLLYGGKSVNPIIFIGTKYNSLVMVLHEITSALTFAYISVCITIFHNDRYCLHFYFISEISYVSSLGMHGV